MPTLGFLKKKKFRDSKDPHSPASPTTDSPTTTSTPTSSAGAPGGSLTSASSNSSHPQSFAPHSADSAQQDGSMSLVDQSTKSNDPHQSAQQYTSAPVQVPTPPYQQSAAHINNLINPPQHDGKTKEPSAPEHATVDVQHDMAAETVATSNVDMSATKAASRTTKGKYQLSDFAIQRTLGTGSFGRVHLVQSRHNQRFYAVKVLKKQQVVKMKQVEHTNDERRMLGLVKHPFLITLWGTFQDSKNLYMVMDFVEGGELFSLLRKSQVGHVGGPLFVIWV